MMLDGDIITQALAGLAVAHYAVRLVQTSVDAVVERSPSIKDNEIWNRVRGSFWWLLLSDLLERVLRTPLPGTSTPVPPPKEPQA